jgi:4-diphosphocytidyl-2-C-methyl-D-erythritol kinase
MRLLAPAKLNLFLRVGSARADGFHPIVSWMVTVGLFDTLCLETSQCPGLSLSCDRSELPVDQNNLVIKAAQLLLGSTGMQNLPGVKIRLYKRIPVGAGLGGGSSDAATVLAGLNRFWKLQLGLKQLDEMAARLGSDVPFFLHGPSSLCTGRGEIVQPVARPAVKHALLFMPPESLATAHVYKRFDEMRLGSAAMESQPDWVQWSQLPAERLLPLLENDLEPAAFGVSPSLSRLRVGLEQSLARPVRMSGSGSCLFTLYNESDEAQSAAEHIGARFAVQCLAAELAASGCEGQPRNCENASDPLN